MTETAYVRTRIAVLVYRGDYSDVAPVGTVFLLSDTNSEVAAGPLVGWAAGISLEPYDTASLTSLELLAMTAG